MALYRLYRGVDARDLAQAFALALVAPLKVFDAFNISGESPFLEADCDQLIGDAATVLTARCPALVDEFARRKWPLPGSIDRVYVIVHARVLLGYAPAFGWQSALDTAS